MDLKRSIQTGPEGPETHLMNNSEGGFFMIRNMKVGTKLIAAFSLVSLAMLVVGALGYVGMGKMSRCANEIAANRMPSIISLQTINESKTAIQRAERAIMIPAFYKSTTEMQRQYKNMENAWKKVDDGWKTYEPLPRTGEEEALWKQFVPAWGEWKKYQGQVVDLVKAGKHNDSLELSIGKTRTALDNAEKLLRDLIALNEREARNDQATLRQTEKTAKISIIIVNLLAVLLALAFGVIISRMITKPIEKVVHMIQEFGKGHLGVRLRLNQQDEIGVMAQAMDQFADDLQNNVLGTMQKIADGDVSMEVTPKDDGDEITPALKKMIESLKGLTSEATMLTSAAVAGKLATRADASKFQGDYKKIVQGVNDTLDAVIGPLNVSAEYVDRIS
jgi:methyl-accepting chemotaxis protein